MVVITTVKSLMITVILKVTVEMETMTVTTMVVSMTVEMAVKEGKW